VRTFLIADVRGYTGYTREHGDEAASRLAACFAAIVRGAVPEYDGELLELRGDEALCVFSSARRALQGAVELQRRFRETVDGQTALPLGVGTGIDSGEAVPTEGGYRGGALNLAGRLCAIAKPGQILASDHTAHLAGRVSGIRLVDRRATRLKGMARSVRLVEVVPEEPLPALPPLPQAPGPPRSLRRTRVVTVAAVALVAAVVSVVVALILLSESSSSSPRAIRVRPNSLATFDARTGRVLGDVPLHATPWNLVVANGSAFVVNTDAGTITRVDLASGASVTDALTDAADRPAGITLHDGWAWVGGGTSGTVLQVDPTNRPITIVHSIRLPRSGLLPPDIKAVAASPHAVWAADVANSIVYKINPLSRRVVSWLPGIDANPHTLAFGYGAIWCANTPDSTITKIDPESGKVLFRKPIGVLPRHVAFGGGAVWVGTQGGVFQLSPGAGTTIGTAPVPTGRLRSRTPTGIAYFDNELWVANVRAAHLLRIDTTTGDWARVPVNFAFDVTASNGKIYVSIQDTYETGANS
jgi:class 3 adenylate cyclase/streptogramin lyase